MNYVRIFRTLQQFKVKYMLCGGLAVNIYGIPRMTADVDLLVDFTEENIANFENAVKVLNYAQTIPIALRSLITKDAREKAMTEKNLIAYSYYNAAAGHMNLDVLLDTPFDFAELWNRRTIKKSQDTEINLVSVEDLIKMKNYSNRIQDQKDVLLLSKLVK